jgi:hypothetical protein
MATKKPFTDEQKDMLMDYLFNKFMNDMMQQKERSEDIYNQPPSTDAIGNEVREAKSNNAFMDMIDKGVNNTKKEGIMTAQQYKLGGDLNYIIEMMKNETDPDKLEELKMQIREMLGTTPYMSIRQDPVRKAADGGIISLAEGGDPLYEMFEEVWENTPASERATGSVKKATVRVTGDPLSYRNFLKDLGFIKTAEAADVKALGKYGVKIGDKIGSISEAARALNIKPFELRSDENFAKLTKLAEDKGVKGFTTVGGAGKASISALEDAATGIGFRGAPDPGGEKIKLNQVIKSRTKRFK